MLAFDLMNKNGGIYNDDTRHDKINNEFVNILNKNELTLDKLKDHLNKGLNINRVVILKPCRILTIFSMICENQDVTVEILKLCLEENPVMNGVENLLLDSISPLHGLASNKNATIEMFELLFEHGADPSYVYCGMTPVNYFDMLISIE